jgi:outer membrane cobalamin receptor
VSPGLRVSGSTLVAETMVSPWVQAGWEFRRGWTMTASTGVSHQVPPPALVATAWPVSRQPERARHVDLGVEQRLGESASWRATVFHRREIDVLPEPFVRHLPLLSIAGESGSWGGLLRGSVSGVELDVQRRSATGLSGWAAYSYGRARHTDRRSGETFWGDADQRHAVSLFGTYRFSTGTGVGTAFRAGAGVPVPGYFARREGRLYAAERRNAVRLPPYARLDVRADHRLHLFGLRMTAFAEMLNVLNRSNVGLVEGTIDQSSGEALGFTSRLTRRRLMAGLAVDF